MGCALTSEGLSGDNYRTIASEEFNSLTPEFEMKWDVIEKTRDEPHYAGGDKLVEFAQQNHMKVSKGYTELVFYFVSKLLAQDSYL